MATVKILGDVFQLKSDLTEAQIKKAEKYDPDILKLKDDEGNELFAVGLGTPSISKYGICFGAVDEDERVFATVTSNSPITKEDVVDSFAVTIANLNRIESQVFATQEAIDALEEAVLDSIEIA